MERIGATVLLIMALLVGAVLVLQHSHVRPGIRITVEMRRTGPLKERALVRLSGLVLGRVDRIRLEPGPKVMLEVWLDGRYAEYVKENSVIFVAREGLFGDAFLAVAGTRGDPDLPVSDGAILRGDDPTPVDRLVGQAQQNYAELKRLAADLAPDWAVLKAALAQMSEELEDFDSALPSLARLRDEVRALEVPDFAPLGGLADVAGQARSQLVAMRPRLRAAGALAERLGTLTADDRFARLSAALDGVGASVARVERMLAIIQGVEDWVQSGRGSVGALLQDIEISDEFRQTRRRVIRQPWQLLDTQKRRISEARPR